MDRHQKIDIELDKLLVNPENYRFKSVTNQQEAMLTMLKSQDSKIMRLAKDIAAHGLNPTRRLLVKETADGKYVVLEGNRRITAIKLMNNPNEIPGDYRFKSIFEDLNAKYKDDLPTILECVVYPENQQGVADSWVLLEHTGENQGIGTVTWNSMQKQRFEAGHKQTQLSKALQVLELLEVKGINISGVEVTNLERLISTPAVRQELGIDFPKKKLLLTESEQDVLQKLKKVVQRMSAPTFVVSHIYRANQRLEWIKDVLAQQPPTSNSPVSIPTSAPVSPASNGSGPASQGVLPFSSSSNNNTLQSAASNNDVSVSLVSQPPPSPSPTAGPVLPPPPSNSNNYPTLVNPTKLLPTTAPAKIASVYKELQTVYLFGQRAAPHAVGALLRILVEIIAQEYLMKKHGFKYDSSNAFRNPSEQGKVYSELREKLNYIANKCNLPSPIAQSLRALVSNQLITTTLNQVMHNTIFVADAAMIKGLWTNFEKVFDHLVSEMQ
jgi:hypothetical protein